MEPTAMAGTNQALPTQAAGTPDLLATLMQRHGALVSGSCRRQAPAAEVDDCIQAVWLVLDRRFQAAARAPSLESWLLRTVGFVCARARRAQRSRRRAEAAAAADPSLQQRPEPAMSRDCDEHLDACLQSLSAVQRTVVIRTYVAGLPGAEVAASLGITPAAVRQHAHRGLERMRELLRRRGIHLPQSALLAALAPAPAPPCVAAPSAAARSYADGALRDWRRHAWMHGPGLLAATSTAGAAMVLGVAAWACDHHQSPIAAPALLVTSVPVMPMATTPPAADPPAVPPAVVTISQVDWRWSPSLGASAAGGGFARLGIRLNLAIAPTLPMSGARVILARVVTDGGLALPVPPPIGVQGRSQGVDIDLSSPPLDAQALTVQGQLIIESPVGAPREVDMPDAALAAGGWFSVAGIPELVFHAGWEEHDFWGVRGTASFVSRTGMPIFHSPQGQRLIIQGTTRFPGSGTLAHSGWHFDQRPGAVSIPVVMQVTTTTVPFTVTASLRDQPHVDDAALAPPTDPPHATQGVLPLAAGERPLLTAAPQAAVQMRCNSVEVSKTLSPFPPRPPGRVGASLFTAGHAAEVPAPGAWYGYACCQLWVTVPTQQPLDILAIDALHVTHAVTDGGEQVAGCVASRQENRTWIDDAVRGSYAGLTAVLRVPEHQAGVFTHIDGTADAIVASAAPRHLQLPLTELWLDRWLAVPGHPACALQLHISPRQLADHLVLDLHIDRTGEMATALRHVRVLAADGHVLMPEGGETGRREPGNYPIDVYVLGGSAAVTLDAWLYTEHQVRPLPFHLTDVPIAVPPQAPAPPGDVPPAQVTVLVPGAPRPPPSGPSAPGASPGF